MSCCLALVSCFGDGVFLGLASRMARPSWASIFLMLEVLLMMEL